MAVDDDATTDRCSHTHQATLHQTVSCRAEVAPRWPVSTELPSTDIRTLIDSEVLRMLSYDAPSGLVLLLDRELAVLVDVSLCVDPWSSAWARERLGVIMVIGHLEISPVCGFVRSRHLSHIAKPYSCCDALPTICSVTSLYLLDAAADPNYPRVCPCPCYRPSSRAARASSHAGGRSGHGAVELCYRRRRNVLRKSISLIQVFGGL
jgi:hypothetical protein